MNEWLLDFSARPDFWLLVSMPLVAAVVGWVTNWLAIEMTFRPLEFIGSKRWSLGWQGIIPAKAGKMAGIMVDNSLARLASLSELFQELEPEKIAAHINRNVSMRLEEYIDELMTERNPVLWENVPLMVRNRVYARARRQLPEILDNIVDDMAENIEQLVDLKAMVMRLMQADKRLVVRIFKEVGDAELRFVVNSGAGFGFLFGLFQLAAYLLHPADWLVPLFGFVVGFLTNWLALNIIFRPLEPIWIGSYCWHGLFMKRKTEVADKFSEICARDIINLGNLMTEIMAGSQAHRSKAIIKRHLRPLLESSVMRTAIQITMGAEGYADLKSRVADKALSMSLQTVSDAHFSRERSDVVHRLLRKRMATMSNNEFQQLLRPAFKEDEWILIMLGAVLGTICGLLQLLALWSL